MKVTPCRVLVHTPKNHIPIGDVYRSADGTHVMLRIKKAKSPIYEEIELFEFIEYIIAVLRENEAA